MKINPVSYLNTRNISSYAPKNQNKLSFRAMSDEFILNLIQKEEKLVKYYKEEIYPKKDSVFDDIRLITYSAEQLCDECAENKFRPFETGLSHDRVESKTKRKGFNKVSFIKVYDENKNKLKKEIEILPNKYIIVRIYNNEGGYDYCKTDYKEDTKEYWQNVHKIAQDDSFTITADKIYCYKGSDFDSYEEGYQYITDKEGYKITIKERFAPRLDCVNYTTGISKDSLTNRETNKGGYILSI